MTAVGLTSRSFRLPGWFAFAVVGLLLVIVTAFVLPIILLEGARDWTAYAQAAGRLATGGPLYIFDTSIAEYYLYPPPMAVVWGWGLTPELFIGLKVAALAGVGVLGARVGGPPIAAGAAAVVLALLTPPVQHDFVLANVMTLYLGVLAASVALRGWAGAVPLGLMVAIAFKPFVVPYVLWLLIRRRSDGVRVVTVAAVATAVFVVLAGPGRYLEYVAALPAMSTLATAFTGNLGLVTISPLAAVAGFVVAYAAAFVAGLRLDETQGAAIALAVTLLAQPTIGLIYAVVLIPAILVLWTRDRAGALAAAVITPILSILTPVLGALVVIAVALRPVRR